MKRITVVPMMALLSLMVVAGCFVQSLYPYYTDKTKIAMPAHIIGCWSPKEAEDSELCEFSDGMFSFSHEGRRTVYEAVFFKVDDVLFVDLLGAPSDSEADNVWLNAHRLNVHQVYKVVTDNNEMVLHPLDFKWVEGQIQSGAVKLSYCRPAAKSKDDPGPIVLTECSEGLNEFLKQCIANPAAFSGVSGEGICYTFRKVAGNADNK